MGNSNTRTAVEQKLQSLKGCLSRDTGAKSDVPNVEQVGYGLHGPDVIISDMKVSGDGVVLCAESMSQDKTYFEVKICKGGEWAIGAARTNAHSAPGLGGEGASWCLTSGQITCFEGDIVGVAFDQAVVPTELRFTHNGEPLAEFTITGIRGEVYPAVFVAKGSELECEFDGENGFAYPPPSGFNGLMACRSLM